MFAREKCQKKKKFPPYSKSSLTLKPKFFGHDSCFHKNTAFSLSLSFCFFSFNFFSSFSQITAIPHSKNSDRGYQNQNIRVIICKNVVSLETKKKKIKKGGREGERIKRII